MADMNIDGVRFRKTASGYLARFSGRSIHLDRVHEGFNGWEATVLGAGQAPVHFQGDEELVAQRAVEYIRDSGVANNLTD